MMEDSLFQNIADLMLERIDHSLYVIKDMGIDVSLICDRHLHRKVDEINMELSEREMAKIFFKLADINESTIKRLSEKDKNFLVYISDDRGFEFISDKTAHNYLKEWGYEWESYAICSIGKAEEGKKISDMNCCNCERHFMVDEVCYRVSDYQEYLCLKCHAKRFPTDREWFEFMLCDYTILKEFTFEDEAQKITISIECTEEYLKKCSDEKIIMLVDWLFTSKHISVIAYPTTAE